MSEGGSATRTREQINHPCLGLSNSTGTELRAVCEGMASSRRCLGSSDSSWHLAQYREAVLATVRGLFRCLPAVPARAALSHGVRAGVAACPNVGRQLSLESWSAALKEIWGLHSICPWSSGECLDKPVQNFSVFTVRKPRQIFSCFPCRILLDTFLCWLMHCWEPLFFLIWLQILAQK